MTLLVRNEADIIEDNVAFHFAMGVDVMIVMDNGSQDGTYEILRRLQRRYPLRLLRQPRHVLRQSDWVTRMARMAAVDYGADWVIDNDADEFWMAVSGDLKSSLASVPARYGAAEVLRRDHPATVDEAGRPTQRMIYRELESTNADGLPLPSKVCHRGYADVVVATGNHAVDRPSVEVFDGSELLRIAHFPARTYEQLERKIVDGGLALEAGERREGQNGVLRGQFDRAMSGSLRAWYEERTLAPDEILARLADGTLIEDPTIRDVLADAADSSPDVHPIAAERRSPITGVSLFVVAGMHRSGTSLIARVLNLLGIDLGDPERLMGPKPDNPTGFWENTDIAHLNDDLLALMGGQWDRPPAATDGWQFDPRLDSLKARGVDLVSELFPDGVGGVKDPRMSLTLPFWETIVTLPTVILTIRHPAAVAESLAARDNMDPEDAARLWLAYALSVAGAKSSVAIVNFDDFISDPISGSSALADALGLDAPDAATVAQIETFVDPSLRHHEDRSEHVDHGPIMDMAVSVYRALSDDSVGALGRLYSLVETVSLEANIAAVEREAARRAWVGSRRHEAELIAERDRVWRERDVLVGERDVLVGERDVLVGVLNDEREERRLAMRRLALKDRELGDLERVLARKVDELRVATGERDEFAARLAEPGLKGTLHRLRPREDRR